MAEEASDARQEAIGRYYAELAELDRQLEGMDSHGGAASTRDRISRNLESQRARLLEQIERLTNEASGAAAASRAAASAESPSVRTQQHPVGPFAGKSVLVEGFSSLQLDDGDHAFSASTRQALLAACQFSDKATKDGHIVVGLDSFVAAALHGLLKAAPQSARNPDLDAVLAGLERRRVEGASVAGAIADGELTQVLADAGELVRSLTPGQVRVDLRHAVLAALATSSGREALVTMGLVRGHTQSFRSAITQVGNLMRDRSLGDSQTVFDEIVAALNRSSLPSNLAERSALHYVADAPPLTLQDDQLGVADDVRALAEVVCLREPGPPLAVGLFGDWGSGKSTFMNLLEAAIDELTARESGKLAHVFVEKVVHVRFNAWHYNDANLWASLTSEFFGQLRAGGHKSKGSNDYAELVKSVAESVAVLDETTRTQSQRALEAQQESARLTSELDTLKAERQTAHGAVLGQVIADAINPKGDAERSTFQAAMQALGHPIDVPKDAKPEDVEKAIAARAEDLKTEVERATALPGRFLQLVRTVPAAMSKGWLITGLCFALVLFAAVGLAVAKEQTTVALVRAWASSVVASGTVLSCVWVALRKAYRFMEPIFRLADTYENRLRVRRDGLEREILEKSRAVEQAERNRTQAEREVAARLAEAGRFREGSPEQVLDHFLNKALATQQFDQQVGTVSQVRRVFEQLDAIFAEQRRLERAKADGPLEKREAGELEKLERLTKGVARIVLYIDDLDRCQVQQVVRVLEATHLLLAFPLFIVVVGIDPRWLRQSLLEVYAGRLRDDGQTANASTLDKVAAAPDVLAIGTVQDYLEKIFQVPIRLSRLRYADGERFTSYLRSVAGPVQPEPPSDPPGTDSAGSKGADQLVPAALREVPLELAPPKVAVATIERIGLRTAELKFIESLAPLIARSPRAVKRFMNVYRLVRGLHRGAELDQFVSPVEGLPRYPAVAFWLAVDVGLPLSLARGLRLLVKDVAKSKGDLGSLANYIKGESVDPAASASLPSGSAELLRAADLLPVVEATAGLLPGPAGIQTLDAAFTYTQRFCLHEIDAA